MVFFPNSLLPHYFRRSTLPTSESDATFHDSTSEPTPDDSECKAALLFDIESLQQQCRDLKRGYLDLEKSLDESREQTKQLHKAQLCAEEKFRRQAEILYESNAARDTALEENKKLVVRLANLQKWTDSMDDDQARHFMGQLYQGLQTWVKRHFPDLLPGYVSRGVNVDEGSNDTKGSLQMLHEIYRCISHHIFELFQTRVTVGIEDNFLSRVIYDIDNEVQRICPTHVGQHWRSAISTAVFSLRRAELETECDRLIAFLEKTFAEMSCTEYQKRTRQLKALLWKFLEFKHRLECQKDSYYFIWFESGTQFCAEYMNDFTGQCPLNGAVIYTTSPALYKIPPGCDWDQSTMVEKASVKTG